MGKLKQLWQRYFKWNRFVAVQQFRSVDRKEHIIILTRNQVLEYNPTGKSKLLFTIDEAEKAPTHKSKDVEE